MTRRLQMDFQPVFMSGLSLRKQDKSHWFGKVRPSVVPKTKPVCSVCGFVAEEDRSLIHVDEVWSFPGPPNVRLDVRPLCVYCHDAKDYASFLIRSKKGTTKYAAEKVIEHYCRVNKCTRTGFDADVEAADDATRKLQELYGWNCVVEIDYCQWARYPGWKPFRVDILKRLKVLFKQQGSGPVEVGDRTFQSFRSAMRFLRPLPLGQRDREISEMIETLEGLRDDEEVLCERDEPHGWNWS